jgi:DNA repair ATPase RecN
LGDTKTLDNKKNLMHYLDKLLTEKFVDVSNFWEELSDVSIATKVALRQVKAEILDLKKGLTHIKVQLELTKSEERFRDIMQVSVLHLHAINIIKEFYDRAASEIAGLEQAILDMQTKFKETLSYYG